MRSFAALLSLVGAVVLAQAPTQAPPQTAKPRPKVGDIAPPFEAIALNDKTYPIEFPKAGGTTVLIFFLSSCPHCQHTLPTWNEAIAGKAKDVKVQGILLDKAGPGFFASYKIDFAVLRAVDSPAVGNAYKIFAVPMTLRIKPGGVIEDVLIGDDHLDKRKVQHLFRTATP